jgi:hypothetical protein
VTLGPSISRGNRAYQYDVHAEVFCEDGRYVALADPPYPVTMPDRAPDADRVVYPDPLLTEEYQSVLTLDVVHAQCGNVCTFRNFHNIS